MYLYILEEKKNVFKCIQEAAKYSIRPSLCKPAGRAGCPAGVAEGGIRRILPESPCAKWHHTEGAKILHMLD